MLAAQGAPSAVAAPAAGALAGAAATALDRAVNAALLGLDATTGAALVAEGREAFALRAAAARAAGRSLDLQYYLWHSDVTGRLLAGEVLRAADRGVQVRMLLDDVFALGLERALAVLDAHPNIEVRLFNGTRWRIFGRFGYVLEMLLGGWHLNRRMHNKAWIADGRLAIAGGRNLADEYFDAAEEFNFRDLDLLLAGNAAAQAVAVFERYWASPLARRASEVSAAQSARGGLPALRGQLAAAAGLPAACTFLARSPRGEDLPSCLEGRLVPVPEEAVRVVADPPEKARRGLGARRRARAAGGIGPEAADSLRAARREALLVSPYFVPGEAGLELLVGLVRRGVRVSVVTNSLAATDVVAVHGGYARYRRALLAAGVELFELKRSGDEPASMFGSRGASLHTKAFVVDEMLVCVGSFNLDPRSAALNTEMGVFAENRALAGELRAEHARLSNLTRSWRVTLEDGRLRWTGSDSKGCCTVLSHEPDASFGRRALAGLVRLLPVEAQL